jgi:flagellar protein FlaI
MAFSFSALNSRLRKTKKQYRERLPKTHERELIIPGKKSKIEPEPKIKSKREKYKSIDLVFEGEQIEKKPEIIKHVDQRFNLITFNLKGRSVPIAQGRILMEPTAKKLTYFVVEPTLEYNELDLINNIKDRLREEIDVEFTRITAGKTTKYIIDNVKEIIVKMNLQLSPEQITKIVYYIYRDFVGLGKIEPLMHDPNIEDISCDGVGIPVFIYHRNPEFGQMPTNIVFKTDDELNNFVLTLAQKSGRALTVAEPLLDGALPDGSRVQATYGTDIATRGSNFTIRKFSENPMTPIDMVTLGTVSSEMMAYLWLAIENGASILFAGSTATGKTSFLNASSLFIPPNLKIVSIEDTAELRLPHENWVPEVARKSFGPKGYGEVTMYDLLRASFRQRPDYLIVGEVRGKEAYVMFQSMATGHPAMGTLHADSFPATIDRLTTEPINLPKAILQNLDIIVYLVRVRKKGKYIRKVKEIVEVVGYDYEKKDLIENTAFTWNAATDSFEPRKSILLDKFREAMGEEVYALKEDLKNKTNFLNWLRDNKISYYRDVADNIRKFYSDPFFYKRQPVKK